MIDPALHLVAVSAQLRHAKRRIPAVVHERLHRNLGPLVGALAVREQRSGNRIVAIGEDIRLDADLIADGAFGGKASASLPAA